MEFIPDGAKKYFDALEITDDMSREIMNKFGEDIDLGLGAATHDSAIVKCFITYVQDLPTGKEKGKFLALDLGGTNFRVLVVSLDEGKFDMQSEIYAISQEIMTGTAEMLFDHIAECLSNFVKDKGLVDVDLALGFTFSFPLSQVGLTKGILQQWNKGFNVSDVVGEDVVQQLVKAIERRGDAKIDVVAVLNDTTGTLMSCAWKKPNCRIGFIIGTGSNACYVEKIERVELFDGDKSKPYVIINTESGAFGNNGTLDFVRTEFDVEIDQNSINPGNQINEKMISGMYLGELVRVFLKKLASENLIFGGKINDKLNTKDLLTTKMLSDVASDPPGSYCQTRMIMMTKFDYMDISDSECTIVQLVCRKFIERSARLCAATLAHLVNRIGESEVVIGVDGSVYRFHPHFHDLLVEYMTPLVDPALKFELMLSEDGSGRGAALVAATAARASGK